MGIGEEDFIYDFDGAWDTVGNGRSDKPRLSRTNCDLHQQFVRLLLESHRAMEKRWKDTTPGR